MVITELPSLTFPQKTGQTEADWPHLKVYFSSHRELYRKEDGPLFGPYRLKPKGSCRKHPDNPQRCDTCVECMTLAVFDADQGPESAFQRCEDNLAAAGLARIWYSSHSYKSKPPNVSLRLVLPLLTPIHPDRWKVIREVLIDRFQIPADKKTSCAVSQAYFLPSKSPGAEHFLSISDGEFLDTRGMADVIPTRRVLPEFPDDDSDSEDDSLIRFDLTEIRKELQQKASRLVRSRDNFQKERGEHIRNLLDCQPLATDGHRREAAWRLAGCVGFMFPNVPTKVLLSLFRPSVEAMQNQGSSVDAAYVRRALVTAKEKKAANERYEAELEKAIMERLK